MTECGCALKLVEGSCYILLPRVHFTGDSYFPEVFSVANLHCRAHGYSDRQRLSPWKILGDIGSL